MTQQQKKTTELENGQWSWTKNSKKSPQEHEENVTLLAIKEMQIKIKMRYHFTTRRMVIIF